VSEGTKNLFLKGEIMEINDTIPKYDEISIKNI